MSPSMSGADPALAHDEESGSEPTGDPKPGLAGVAGLTPISGGDRASTAPSIETGRYLDTAPDPGNFKGYAVNRTISGSTVTFGVTLLGQAVDPAKRLVVRLDAPKPDGSGNRRCGAARFDADDRATTMPLSTVAGWSWQRRACRDTDVLYLVVENTARRRVPAGTPYELDIWEQPPVSNISELDSSVDTDWVHADADDPQVQAEPGVSMSEAVPLPDGETAAVDLPLGQISWFYVRVRLGDRVQALVETADGGSVAGAGLEVRILSPVGGMIDGADSTTILPAAQSTSLAAGPGLVSAVTYEVDPHHRYDAEHSDGAHNVALAGSGGNYPVAVYAQRPAGSSVSSLPVTIKVQTNPPGSFAGDNDGLAEYAGEFPPYPAPSGPLPEAYDPDVPNTSAPSEPRGRSTAEWLLIGGLGGAALLVGLLGGVLAGSQSRLS